MIAWCQRTTPGLYGFALILWTMILVSFLAGCTPPRIPTTPRDRTRAAVVLVARAVAAADEHCASTAMRYQDLTLATKCAKAYDVARPSLLAAEHGVDAWELGQEGQAACSLRQAVLALGDMSKAMTSAGEPPPGLVDDAITFAGQIGGCP